MSTGHELGWSASRAIDRQCKQDKKHLGSLPPTLPPTPYVPSGGTSGRKSEAIPVLALHSPPVRLSAVAEVTPCTCMDRAWLDSCTSDKDPA